MKSSCFQLADVVIEVKSKKNCPAGFQIGDRFSVFSIVPEGFCPYMYHLTTHYLEAIENGALFRPNENYIVVTCPNPKAAIAVKILRHKNNNVTLEILSKNYDCPYYNLKVGGKWQVSKGKKIFCRQAFDSLFPYLSILSSEIRGGKSTQNVFTAACPGYPDFAVFQGTDGAGTEYTTPISHDFVKIKEEEKMESNLKGKNVLITGAAYGIGAAVAELLAKEGCRLCLVDIDGDQLKKKINLIKNNGDEPMMMIKDLSKADERESVFRLMAENGFKLDILINNVGVGFWRHLKDTPWEKIEEIIKVNIHCMTHMAKLALPDMLARNAGHIVNMSSTAAFIGAPNAVCYSATKAYIRIFSETLEMELVKTGIKVTCIFPGATDTHFWEYANMTGGKYHRNINRMTAGDVAREVISAIKRDKSAVVVGNKNKFNMLVTKFLPREMLKKAAIQRFED